MAMEGVNLKEHIRALVIPILIFLICLLLLIWDFSQRIGGDDNGEVLAKFSRTEGDVKRKPEKRMVWYEGGADQDLYLRDTIRTTAGSVATIRFDDGSIIEMSENSLIVLERTKGAVMVDFVTGNVSSKTEGALKFRANGVDLEAAKSTEVVLAGGEGKESSVNVRGGEVTVSDGDKKVVIGENKRGSLKDGGLGEVEELSVRLVSPKSGELILTQKDRAKLDLTWEILKKQKGLKLEISQNSAFQGLDKVIKVGNSEKVNVVLEPGRYYWRIRADKKKQSSEIYQFQVQPKIALRLLDPRPNEMVTYAKTEPSVLFRWLAPAYYDNYQIEISKDRSFREVFKTNNVKSASQFATTLGETGTFFWRVRGFSASGEEIDASEIREIILKKEELAPPRLISPAPGYAIKEGEENTVVTFRWNYQQDFEEYEIEIASDPEFKNIIESDERSTSSFSWTAPKRGRYYWRVAATSVDGESVKAGEKRSFIVVPPEELNLVKPADGENFHYKARKPRIELAWNKLESSPNYEVEVARDVAFKEGVLKKTLTQSELKLADLVDGDYFWRVRAVDKKGDPLEASQVRSFRLKGRDLLRSPELFKPEAGFISDVYDPKDAEFAFSWEKLGQAKEYQLLIQRLEPGEDPDRIDESKARVVRFRKNSGIVRDFKPAQYLWAVRGVDQYGRPGEVGRIRLMVVNKGTLLAPPSNIEIEVKQIRK